MKRVKGEPMSEVHLRIPTALYREVRVAARKRGASVNREMIHRLKWSLQAEQLRRVVIEAVDAAFERREAGSP